VNSQQKPTGLNKYKTANMNANPDNTNSAFGRWVIRQNKATTKNGFASHGKVRTSLSTNSNDFMVAIEVAKNAPPPFISISYPNKYSWMSKLARSKSIHTAGATIDTTYMMHAMSRIDRSTIELHTHAMSTLLHHRSSGSFSLAARK